MPESENNIEIRSEEVQEILSRIPHWIIRWGITLIFAVILIILFASWFIEYPDVVTARVKLTTSTPPAHLVAKTSGRIDLLVEDQSRVKEGDILAIVENPASLDDILKVDGQLSEIKNKIYQGITQIEGIVLDETLDLGELQNPYLSFISAVEEVKRLGKMSLYQSDREVLRARIEFHKKENENFERQEHAMKEEVAIARDVYESDSILYDRQVRTKLEMNRSKSSYLQIKRNLEILRLSLIQGRRQIVQLDGEITSLVLREQQEQDQLKNKVINAYEQLESQLINWKQTNLLITPIDGTVSFNDFWSDDQFVQLGEEVISIIPPSKEDIIGTITMPIMGSGKVEEGQRVNMKFDNYPSAEYGMIIGQIESISLVPRNDMYTIRVILPNKLESTYRKQLGFKQEMQGTADIITDDKRLIERVFNQLRNILDQTN